MPSLEASREKIKRSKRKYLSNLREWHQNGTLEVVLPHRVL